MTTKLEPEVATMRNDSIKEAIEDVRMDLITLNDAVELIRRCAIAAVTTNHPQGFSEAWEDIGADWTDARKAHALSKYKADDGSEVGA